MSKTPSEFVIGPKEAGQSAEKYLHKVFPAVPASFWFKSIRKNGIKVNGKHLKDIKQMLGEGDKVTLYMVPEETCSFCGGIQHKSIEPILDWPRYVRVVYEDEHLLVLDKPAGVLSQKAKPSDVSINEYALAYLMANGYEPAPGYKPGVINRLDQPTRGLILFPKDVATASEISTLIRTGQVGKYYYATVHCKQLPDGTYQAPNWNKTLLRHFWVKDEQINKVALSDAPKDQKNAQEVLSEATLVETTGATAKIELKLITGKSHQLRAQMAYEGYPIVGDKKYGVKDGVEELGLVAWKIEVPNYHAPTFLVTIPFS